MKTAMNRTVQISVLIILIVSGLGALIYNLPFASSVGAYDVSLTVDSASKEVSPGSQVNYALTITNDGNNGDKYTITASTTSIPSSWTVTLSQTSTGNIGSGSSTSLTVTVRAPSTLNVTDYCSSTITVKSQTDPTNSTASVLLSTSVKRTYGVSMSSPSPIRRLNPGGSAEFTINVKNDGNDRDGFTLTSETTLSGWSTAITFDTGKINPGATKQAKMTLQSPSDAFARSYQFMVKATSTTDSTISATFTLTATVNQTYGCLIASEGTKTVDINTQSVVNFNVRVTNMGNGEDRYNLEYYIPPTFKSKGWNGGLSTSSTIKLQPDAFQNVTFSVFTPSKSFNPPKGFVADFYINATSVGDGTLKRQVKVSCSVLAYYDVNVANTGPSTKTVAPDSSVQFSFNVTNTGNDQDTFALNTNFGEGFRDSFIDPSSVTLAAQATTKVTVTIDPDADVVKAQSYRFRIYANSTKGANHYADFSVSINKKYGAYLDAPNGAIISDGQPGSSYKILVRLQNKGNGRDAFDMKVKGETTQIDTDWRPLISSSSTPLINSEGWFYFNVTVSAPSTVSEGTYRFLVNATSKNSPAFANLYLSVRIPQLYRVDISANKQSVKAKFSNTSGVAERAIFSLDVYNKGSGTDASISLFVKQAPSVFAGLYSIYFTENQKSKISIGPAASKPAKLDMEMPKIGSGVAAGTYFIIVEVVSDNGTTTKTSDDKRAELNLSLILEPVHRVQILSGINSSQVSIGSSITFKIIIQNRGTTNDYYQISLTHPNYGPTIKWSIPDANLTTKILAPLAQETITLTATIANGADPDWGSVWVKVTATHSTDLTVKDEKYFTAVFASAFAGDLSTADNFEQNTPGKKAWYNLTLENWGTRTKDNFRIEVENELEFENIVITPASFSLGPNQRVRISINISIPSIDDKIIPTGTYDLIFKAISDGQTTQKNDDVVVDNITLKLKVMPVYKLQFLIPLGSTTAKVGSTVQDVKLNITNKGNEVSTVTLTVDSTTQSKYVSWVTMTPGTISNLKPNIATDALMDVKVPTTATAEKVTLTIRATVSGKSVFSTATFEVIVDEDYRVDLTVPDSITLKEANPLDTVDYTVKMVNDGNTVDSFDIELSSAKSTWATFGFLAGTTKTSETTTTNVPIKGVEYIWLTIVIPEDAPAGEQTFTIKAISQGDDAITDTIALRVDVNPKRAVELSATEESKELIPDVDAEYTEVSFDVQVINKGEAGDTFKIEVVQTTTSHPHLTPEEWANTPRSDKPTWIILSKKVTGTIAKDGSETIKVTVRVPNTQYDPAQYDSVIWAYSEGETGTADDQYSKPIVLTTEVKQAYGADILTDFDTLKTKIDSTDATKIYVSFTVLVENTGTGVDSFKLEERDDLPTQFSFVYSPSTQLLDIDPDDRGQITVRIEMPVDTLTQKYTFEVRWISQGDDSAWDTTGKDYMTSWKELTIEVAQTYDVTLDALNEEMDGEVGKDVSFTMTVENLGNDQDTFRIEVDELDETDGWATLSKTKVTLDAQGKSTDQVQFTVTVRVPNDNEEAKAGTYRFNVSVMRDSNNREERMKAWDYMVLKVKVKESYSHEVTSDEDIETAKLGDMVSYRFKVYNKANTRDTFELSVKGKVNGWGELSREVLSLDANQETYVYLNVTVPLLEEDPLNPEIPYVNDPQDVEAGKYDFDVEVSSRGNKDADPEILTFTVDVEQEYAVFVTDIDPLTAMATPLEWDVNDVKTLEIKFTVENQGNKDDTFYIKKPSEPTGWDIELSTTRVLVPLGDQKSITATIKFRQTPGFDTGLNALKFEVWPADGQAEGKNARVSFTAYVKALAPDLSITESSFDLPKDLTSGSSYKVKVQVTNIGDVKVDDVEVTLYDNDKEVSVVSGDINAGQSTNFTFTWPATRGSHTLKAVINEGFIDADDGNNEAKIEKELSQWDIRNYLSSGWILLILVILFIVALVVAFLIAWNKNKEIRELEDVVAKLKSDRGVPAGGPRKVMKEAAGAPMAPRASSGLPGPGAAALGPAPGRVEEPKPARREAVKVQCPKCKSQQVVNIDRRPAEVPCRECGVTLVIPEKK